MDKIIIKRYDDGFSLLLDDLDRLEEEYWLSELYEILFPWEIACEEVFPPLFYLFMKKDEYKEYNSWKEMKDILPYLSLVEIEEDRVVLEISEIHMHEFVFMLLAVNFGADIEMIADEEIVSVDPYFKVADSDWERDGYRCKTEKNRVTLTLI